ncbi:MAG: leucine-rich repeat domain-containing protein, partial [Treponema sp.]|nr:leucine-rich repeat domain-containing protein [Treponema sp.]
DKKEKAVAVNNVTVQAGRAVTASDLCLTRTGSITGRVSQNNSATGNYGFLVCVAGTSYMAVTADNGSFTIDDIPAGGNYLIIIMKGNWTALWSTETVTVRGGEATALGPDPNVISVTGDSGGLLWQGEYPSEAALIADKGSPQPNWAYFNTADKTSYIWNGTAWDKLAVSGEKGDPGDPGKDGASGSSPFIGENGNWWIGDYDTEIKAQGENGENGENGANGVTPHIGLNGNWWIGSEDTGVTAQGGEGGTGGGGIEAVRLIIDQALAAGGANDGSSPEKALTLSFAGSGLDLFDDIAMKALFYGIKDYYVNLDLTGVKGEVFAFYPLSADIDKSKIISLTLDSAVKEIVSTNSNQAFIGYSGMKSITAPGVKIIRERALQNCYSLESVSFPAAESIGAYAFQNCYSLTSVSFPVAESIGERAFSGCAGLESVSFPLAESIGYYAFYGCAGLESVSFPNVKIFGNGVFSSTVNTTLVITMGSTAPVVGINTFASITYPKTVTVKVPPTPTPTGYGSIPGVYSGSDNTQNWGNAFRGMGWDGTNYLTSSVNSNITLNIEFIE